MSRKALARLYRPRRFGEMAMQEHVSETLKSAVARGRTAHAYLFTGPRGVGKTTAARVLAMALNCAARSEDGEPCGECESCVRIWAGQTSLDVVEIDAASNRGVDDARDLRERAMYAPTDERRYKVYIIDEAHMLTREAWNALLKILEEPPPRVIFVFATTEPQKIQQAAPPILSRCQRFDFRRISVTGIVERLREVLAREGLEAEEEALYLLARRADGGMRDALSLLDQVLALAGGGLTAADVRRVLGLVGEELYLELFRVIAERRHAGVFHFVARLVDEGYDFADFYRGLADALRALLVCRLEGPAAADVREDLKPAFAEVASSFAVGDLLRMLAQVAELDTEGRFRKSGNPRIQLEALLLRFTHLDRTVELEEVLRAAAGDPNAEALPLPGAASRDAGRPAVRPAPAAPRPPASAPGRGAPAGESARSRQAASAPPAPAAPATADVGTVEAHLRRIAESGEGMQGLKVFLRAARVAAVEEGRVVIELPPGPGLDRLTSERPLQQRLAARLAESLGRPIVLDVRAAAEPTPADRLTPERVRDERLARLAREEPVLGKAVQEWELELRD